MAMPTAPHQPNPQMQPSGATPTPPATPTVSNSPRTTAEAEAIQQNPGEFKLRTPAHIGDPRTMEDDRNWREGLAREHVELDKDQVVDPVHLLRLYGDRVDSFTEMRAIALETGQDVLAMAARARAAKDTPADEQAGDPELQGQPGQPEQKKPPSDQLWGNQEPVGKLGAQQQPASPGVAPPAHPAAPAVAPPHPQHQALQPPQPYPPR